MTLETPRGGAALAVSQQELPAALLAARTGATTWTGALPDQGALVLDVVSLRQSGASIPYTLTVTHETHAAE